MKEKEEEMTKIVQKLEDQLRSTEEAFALEMVRFGSCFFFVLFFWGKRKTDN